MSNKRGGTTKDEALTDEQLSREIIKLNQAITNAIREAKIGDRYGIALEQLAVVASVIAIHHNHTIEEFLAGMARVFETVQAAHKMGTQETPSLIVKPD